MGLPQAGLVQLLEVDDPLGLAGLLGNDVRWGAPYSWLAQMMPMSVSLLSPML